MKTVLEDSVRESIDTGNFIAFRRVLLDGPSAKRRRLFPDFLLIFQIERCLFLFSFAMVLRYGVKLIPAKHL
jgi:hypothetical protein